MVDRKDLAMRAANQLSESARGLRFANALFHTIHYAVAMCRPGAIDVSSLMELGCEVTGNYGELAGEEADFFSGEAE